MADNPLRPCKKLGCPELTRDLSGYCEKHRHLYEQKQRDYEKNRKSAYQRGYNNRWRKTSKNYLREHPLCVECLKEGKITPATVVDHKKPHKGNKQLFWDKNNWQSLCKHHHDIKTATEDGGFGHKRDRGI